MPHLKSPRELRLARHALYRIPDPDAELAALELGTKDTYRVLAALLAKYNHLHATKDKTVSNATMTERGNFLFHFFRRLRAETRFKHIDPRNLGSRHVMAMLGLWTNVDNKTPGTIHVYLSYLRVFCDWIGKPGMVHPAHKYLGATSRHAHRSQVATTDHSWEAQGVDVPATIAKVTSLDPWVGLQLELCWHFGLRAKEAMFFRPHEALRDRENARNADTAEFPEASHFVRVRRGTKGGRDRDVPILTDTQRELLARCQSAVPMGGFVGQQQHSPPQARNRFYWILRKAGITKRELGVIAHGLRHGYANDLYETKSGALSPVRGADAKPERHDDARLAVARALGHGRARVTEYYIGSIQQNRPPRQAAEDQGVADKSDEEAGLSTP